LASSVVSHATRAALDAGKVPLYLHDVNNQASSRVSLRVGYRPYGYELTCEAGRVMPRRG
jgi:predicted GNAT family acetyltransferase